MSVVLPATMELTSTLSVPPKAKPNPFCTIVLLRTCSLPLNDAIPRDWLLEIVLLTTMAVLPAQLYMPPVLPLTVLLSMVESMTNKLAGPSVPQLAMPPPKRARLSRMRTPLAVRSPPSLKIPPPQ